jgi:hypothetical protein
MTTQLLNFQRQFVDAVLSGEKQQTIRLIRSSPVEAGDELRLYAGLRQPGARLLRVETCAKIELIDFLLGNEVIVGDVKYKYVIYENNHPNLLDLSLADGFTSPGDFLDFFVNRYGPLPIVGRLCCIYWTPTVEGLAQARDIMAERIEYRREVEAVRKACGV